MAVHFAFFSTSVGECAVAWSEEGIRRTYLPAASPEQACAILRAHWPDATEAPPPPDVEAVVRSLQALVAGGRADFTAASLDMRAVPRFHQAVYEAARQVPPGRTVTYGQLAEMAGSPGAARAVGQAMAMNPFPLVVPCHRVVAAGSKLGGFSAEGGLATKERLLRAEGWAPPARPRR